MSYNITLQRLKNAVKDIKSEWYEGNDSHSIAEYRGACESLDMLVTHFQKLDDFTKWKKEKKMRVTKEDMELWIGTDEKGDYPKQAILEILCELANGDYEQEQFKSDVLDYREE